MEEKVEREEAKARTLENCGECAHFGFSFSCVEGFCLRKGKPVEDLAPPCEDFRPAGG